MSVPIFSHGLSRGSDLADRVGCSWTLAVSEDNNLIGVVDDLLVSDIPGSFPVSGPVGGEDQRPEATVFRSTLGCTVDASCASTDDHGRGIEGLHEEFNGSKEGIISTAYNRDECHEFLVLVRGSLLTVWVAERRRPGPTSHAAPLLVWAAGSVRWWR